MTTSRTPARSGPCCPPSRTESRERCSPACLQYLCFKSRIKNPLIMFFSSGQISLYNPKYFEDSLIVRILSCTPAAPFAFQQYSQESRASMGRRHERATNLYTLSIFFSVSVTSSYINGAIKMLLLRMSRNDSGRPTLYF